jgi:NADPH:quinone reductase
VTDQALDPDEIRVRVHAAGLNRADLLDGRRRGGPLPGRELAGEVIEVGSEVPGWQIGQRIMSRGAGFAPEAVVLASHSMPVPESLSYEEAGALPVALMTMHDAIVTNGHLAPGQRVLVHAATSGVGVTAVQLGALRGASTVFATSRSADKLAVLRSFLGDLPCEVAWIDTSTTSFAQVATDVDVVVDNVGASVLAGNIAACRIGGRIVQVGRLGGREAQIDLDELARKRVSLVGVTFRTRNNEEVADIVERAVVDVGGRLDALRPRIERAYPLADLDQALADLGSDRHVGKLVVVPGRRGRAPTVSPR